MYIELNDDNSQLSITIIYYHLLFYQYQNIEPVSHFINCIFILNRLFDVGVVIT